MIKNERHSIAAKKLKEKRKMCSHYQCLIVSAKAMLTQTLLLSSEPNYKVSALKSINQDIERKPKCFMTPLQVKATEETLYKISGIKVNINSIRDFKELEEYYQ